MNNNYYAILNITLVFLLLSDWFSEAERKREVFLLPLKIHTFTHLAELPTVLQTAM